MPKRAALTHCLVCLGRRGTGREGAGEVELLVDSSGASGKRLLPFPVPSGMDSGSSTLNVCVAYGVPWRGSPSCVCRALLRGPRRLRMWDV